jgi:xylulokinase
MRTACVLGVDIGTSSCKVCAVDAEGRLAGVASQSYPIMSLKPGWSEQDPREWVPALEGALKAVGEKIPIHRPDVGGLAVSSAAHIAVLMDKAHEPVRESILWNDQRSDAEAARLAAESGLLIFQCTRNQASPTWTLPQLLWVKRHEPDVWKRVRSVCLSKDYVIGRLTGRFCTDPATAVSSLLYDVDAEHWSDSLCDLLGIGATSLPEVVPATAIAGNLLPEMAERLGLPTGIPVITGTLDSVSESYCAGAVRPGDSVLRLGTAGGVQTILGGPPVHSMLISYPHVMPRLWLSQAGTNACGASIQWATQALGGASGMTLDDLDRLAASAAPGSEGLFFHPYLAGERCPHWDSRLRGSFVGLSLHHGREHLARAILEGVAYSLKDAFSALQDGKPQGGTGAMMTVVGGGVRSAILARIVCDVFGCPIRVAPEVDSAYGAALLGLVALGWVPELAGAAANPLRSASELHPDPATTRRYAEAFLAYREIHQGLRDFYHSEPGISDA